MKKTLSLLLLSLLLPLSSCVSSKKVQTNELPFAKVYTAAWMQRSAEYEALCYQAFNGARFYLQQSLELQQEDSKPLAIVTDIDETVLDNSPNAVHLGLQGKLFEPDAWTQWCDMAAADTVPGALMFLKEASAAGVEIFYISNRKEREREGTLRNLQNFGFPNADNRHLILKSDTSNKDERRAKVLEEYEVIIYMGDQLTDFPGYNHMSEVERSAQAIVDTPYFGGHFILLPNPNYGEWESALFNFRRLSPEEQTQVIKSTAKGY